jgi:hypothetical protein
MKDEEEKNVIFAQPLMTLKIPNSYLHTKIGDILTIEGRLTEDYNGVWEVIKVEGPTAVIQLKHPQELI